MRVQWRSAAIPDDPPKQSNVRGTLAYAFTTANTRATQLFINLADNKQFDPQGFAPIGLVTSGMDVVDRIYAGYGEPSGGGMRAGHQDALFAEGNAYLIRQFPRLDYIRKARLITRRRGVMTVSLSSASPRLRVTNFVRLR